MKLLKRLFCFFFSFAFGKWEVRRGNVCEAWNLSTGSGFSPQETSFSQRNPRTLTLNSNPVRYLPVSTVFSDPCRHLDIGKFSPGQAPRSSPITTSPLSAKLEFNTCKLVH